MRSFKRRSRNVSDLLNRKRRGPKREGLERKAEGWQEGEAQRRRNWRVQGTLAD